MHSYVSTKKRQGWCLQKRWTRALALSCHDKGCLRTRSKINERIKGRKDEERCLQKPVKSTSALPCMRMKSACAPTLQQKEGQGDEVVPYICIHEHLTFPCTKENACINTVIFMREQRTERIR
eukprot:1159868-Pelagomonas_calceolata.AAC.1